MMSGPWWRKGFWNSTDKSGQAEGGGLNVSGHPLQCGLCKREEGIYRSFHHHLSVLKIEK